MTETLIHKTIAITGAARGIGRAIAIACSAAGARVALLVRNSVQPLDWPRAIPAPALVFTGDVGDEESIRRFSTAISTNLTRIDGLVNNAGVLTPRSDLVDVTSEDWEKTMRVNLRGPFLLIKHLAPLMVRSGGGSIVNVSSGAGKRPAPSWGPYAVSKAGVESLTALAAAELARSGVRVNAVNPGGTRTRMRAAAYPDEDPMTLPAPDDVAALFVWLLSDASREITGQSIDFSTWRAGRDRGA